VTAIGTNVDTFLTAKLGPFFTAVQAATAHANAAIRYYYNVGLPLPLQSSSQPTDFVISINFSLINPADAAAVLAAALRSWMRIQWSGTTAQAAAMNGVIAAMAMNTTPMQSNAAQTPMLSEDDPQLHATVDAAIAPTQKFHDHLVTKP
jgi:hypothetical protein